MLLEKAMAWNHGGGAFGLAHRRRPKFLDQSLDPGHNLVHLYGIHCGFISFNGSVLGDSLIFAKKNWKIPLGLDWTLALCILCPVAPTAALCFQVAFVSSQIGSRVQPLAWTMLTRSICWLWKHEAYWLHRRMSESPVCERSFKYQLFGWMHSLPDIPYASYARPLWAAETASDGWSTDGGTQGKPNTNLVKQCQKPNSRLSVIGCNRCKPSHQEVNLKLMNWTENKQFIVLYIAGLGSSIHSSMFFFPLTIGCPEIHVHSFSLWKIMENHWPAHSKPWPGRTEPGFPR